MRVLGERRRRSTSRSRRPAASPTSSSSASCSCRDALAPRGELRRPLPRRAPDRGRRGAARRRALRLRRRVGVRGRRQRRRRSTRSRSSSRTSTSPSGATSSRQSGVVEGLHTPWTSSSRSGARPAPTPPARSRTYDATDVSPEMSFLEMFDVLNERLIAQGQRAGRVRPRLPRGHLRLVLDDDQRPGARAPRAAPPPASCTCASSATATTITVEPWRATAFPIIKDLVVDRSAFDRIIEAGGYITAPTGSAPDANLILVPKEAADAAMDAAACIGCGACVAACPNGAAQLFTAAKVAHLNLLPQGQPERYAAGRQHGRGDGAATSARARTTASARRRARRRSASTSSRC